MWQRRIEPTIDEQVTDRSYSRLVVASVPPLDVHRHDSRAMPTVRMSESITPARSPAGFRRFTRTSRPATRAG